MNKLLTVLIPVLLLAVVGGATTPAKTLEITVVNATGTVRVSSVSLLNTVPPTTVPHAENGYVVALGTNQSTLFNASVLFTTPVYDLPVQTVRRDEITVFLPYHPGLTRLRLTSPAGSLLIDEPLSTYLCDGAPCPADTAGPSGDTRDDRSPPLWLLAGVLVVAVMAAVVYLSIVPAAEKHTAQQTR